MSFLLRLMRDKSKKSKLMNLFTGPPLITSNTKHIGRIMIVDMTQATGFTFGHEKQMMDIKSNSHADVTAKFLCV